MRNIAFMILVLSSLAFTQTGGGYDLSHAVVAGGGATTSTGGSYVIGGTMGQAVAGTASTGGTYSLRGGFWIGGPLAPTAAGVSLSGRVRTSGSRGIRGAVLVLTAPDGSSRQTVTNTFGYFRFDRVAAGNTYTLQVISRRFAFASPFQLISVNEDIAGVDYVAEP